MMKFTRCVSCLLPNTKPDLFIHDDGECSACKSYKARTETNWEQRKHDIELLLERGKNSSGYDCIVPSSGGKDSTYQVARLLELGARPLVVTATTCHLTPIGRANIDNLARYATTIEVSPNKEVRKKLNQLGLKLIGEISWPEHSSIFTVPFRMAKSLGIPLVFYGENPQREYGGPIGSDMALQMTRRWVSEFGGFLGLRPDDFVGQMGITDKDMNDYRFPQDLGNVEAHFLGQYFPWDSRENAKVAIGMGMRYELPGPMNWWPWENQDNAQTCIHDRVMWLKYGFGRMCSQLSVDIRHGIIDRQSALDILNQREHLFPWVYCGLTFKEICEGFDMEMDEVIATMEKFRNKDIHVSGSDHS